MGTPVNLIASSQQCQGVPFPQSAKIRYFCSGPVSVDPICPQPKGHPRRRRGALRPRPGGRLRAVLDPPVPENGLDDLCQNLY